MPATKTKPDSIEAELSQYRRGRVPRPLRRKQLLAQAHDLFAELGYHGVSMDELARRMGVSKPVIYDLAGSKEQLFRDVMARVDEELTACVAMAVASAPDGSSKLHAGILAFLRFVQEHRAAWAALLAADARPASLEMAALRRKQAKQVSSLVIASMTPGEEAPDPRTAEALALAINGAVEFVALWWQEHPDISAEAPDRRVIRRRKRSTQETHRACRG